MLRLCRDRSRDKQAGRKRFPMQRPILYSLTFSFAITIPLHAAPATLHVAPDGDNANPGTLEKPLAGLAGARDAIRKRKKDGALAGPVEVVFAPGVYRLEEPVVFTPEDSGTADAPILYRGAGAPRVPGAPAAVISGGRRIEGWARAGDFFKAPVPEAKGEDGWHFTQLYVNGHRRPRARGPNAGAYFRPVRALPGSDSRWGFQFRGDEFRRWPNLDDVNVVCFSSWFTTTHFIETLDEQRKTVRFTAHTERPFDYYEPAQRYYIENVREYLDAPGEWFLDREEGALLYLPLPDETPETLDAWAPVVRRPRDLDPLERIGQLLHFRGDPEAGRPVEYLEFRDLAFRHTDAFFSHAYGGSRQAAPGRDAAIYARGLCHAVFENVEVAQTGEHAIFLHDGSCHNTIRHCLIHDLGAGGVLCGGNWRWGTRGHATHAAFQRIEDAPPPVTHNVIENNIIRDGGYVFHGIHGVWLGHASHHSIRHNEISDLTYSGISAGWDWSGKESTAHHNAIEFNHIHRIGLGVLNDLAGIYTLGQSPGSTVRHNLIHDIRGYESPVSYIVSAGIYHDMSSAHFVTTHNVIHHVVNCGFFYHENAAITCENNVFAHFTHRERKGKQRPDACVWAMFDLRRGDVGSTFRKNILYGDVRSLFNYRVQGAPEEGGPPPIRIDRNAYRIAPGARPEITIEENERCAVPLKEWQAAGFDRDSLFGDPGFVDAANNDFSLREDAPARDLGIESIEVSGVGLTGEESWRRLPDSFPPRKEDPPTDYVPEPLPPLSLDETYEFEKVGYVPENAQGPISVIDHQAAAGRHSLKFSNRPGLDRPYWPIRSYTELLFEKGEVKVSFDFKQNEKQPAWLRLELRDWREKEKLIAGPRIDILPDGMIKAGNFSHPIPKDAWCHLELSCRLGGEADDHYLLRLALPGAAPVEQTLPCAARGFRVLTWFGLMMPDEEPGTIFLDNLRFEVVEP